MNDTNTTQEPTSTAGSRESAADAPSATNGFPPDGPVRLAVGLREPYPFGAHEQQASVLERARDLAAADAVESVDVAVWGHHVPADPPAGAPAVVHEVRERIAAFERWADECGCSLSPAFETREWRGDVLTTTTGAEVVRLPLMTIAVYADDELAAVVPSRGGPVETVPDCLTVLERSLAEPDDRHDAPADAGHDDAEGNGPERPEELLAGGRRAASDDAEGGEDDA